MRTEKELWEVVLSRPDLFGYGLCGWVMFAREGGYISWDECAYLEKVLDKNLPPRIDGWMWCWNRGEIQPRIEWIKNRIKQLENENCNRNKSKLQN